MATIQFEDGTKVRFDGNPTQADIEEVAKQLTSQKSLSTQQAPPQEEGGFWGNLAKDVTRPVAQFGAQFKTAGQQLKNLGGLLKEGPSGDWQQYANKPVPETQDMGWWGDVDVMGRGGAVQTLKEGAGLGLEMASWLPVGRAAKAGYVGAKQLGRQFVKPFVREGVVGGALAEGGRSLQEGDNVGEAALRAGLGGLGGGMFGLGMGIGGRALSSVARGSLGTMSAGARALEDVTGMHVPGLKGLTKVQTRQLSNDLADQTAKALAPTAKTSAGAASTVAKKQTQAMEILGTQGRGLEVVDADGIKKAFDPKTATYGETLQAFVQLKNKFYNTYAQAARDAGQAGAKINKKEITDMLKEIASGPRASDVKNRANQLIKELKGVEGDPVSMMTYLQDINSGLSAKILGRSESAARGVDVELAKLINQKLDDVMKKVDLPKFKDARKSYGALKSIEDDLTKSARQHARQVGGGLSDYVDAFSIPEVLVGIMTAQPAIAAAGGLRLALASMLRMGRNRERALSKALTLGEQLGTGRPGVRKLDYAAAGAAGLGAANLMGGEEEPQRTLTY